ncbi:hypothetical protein [Caulobacter sp. 17J80-11]|uniref:hypothetical protein n=1 Tax=Caulobacter sp. 17J80-11 TaxID=2763502 RepID=UPI001653D58E|nr:hypothetical protein [Caulobacter sp. 17J80-11]MBC6981388.1 hypothetical protein [Caulobacter sp. 17J80-11]
MSAFDPLRTFRQIVSPVGERQRFRYGCIMHSLTARYEPDDDGTGELLITVQGDYAGTGAAWFSEDQLNAFCDALERYPLDKADLPRLEGGYWDDTKRGGLKERHVGLLVAPHDALGSLSVSVSLAEPAENADPYARRRAVTTWFLVGYNEVAQFARELKRLVAGGPGSAVLERRVS